MGYTRAQKRAEISRELALRRRVYPRMIDSGRMTQDEADSHIAILVAIWDDYNDDHDRRQKELSL